MNASLKRLMWSVPLLLCALVVAMADVNTTQLSVERATTTTAAATATGASVRPLTPKVSKNSTTKPATQPVSVAPSRPPRDYYEPLIRKNIFLKTPGQSGFFSSTYTPLPPQTAPASTTRLSGESSWILTGTAIGVGSPAALVENSDSGEVLRVRAGDSTVAGRVIVIDANGINIQGRSGVKHVPLVGSSLDGNAMPATLPAASTQSESTGEGPSEDSILERLRRLCLKEMGK